MKAVFFEEHGGPEVLKYGDLPDPTAENDEVVVTIHSASVNGADWKVRAGAYAKVPHFPYICGRDFSGIVETVGDEVTDLKPGDAVFGVLPAGQEGTYCEKVATKASVLAKKPQNISHLEINALSLIGLTAVISIEDTLKLQPNEKILIQGGAGGVGGYAIQLAKHIGAYVISTARENNREYVLGLGADEVIDYTKTDFTNFVSDCDAVFETVGGEVGIKSFQVLKPGGRAAFIASGTQAPTPTRDDVKSLRPKVGRDRSYMERVLRQYQTDAVQPPEMTCYALTDAPEAQRVSEGRHLRGKLMLKIL